jgi:hypothetical protein
MVAMSRVEIGVALMCLLASGCAESAGTVAYEAGDERMGHTAALAYCDAVGGAPVRLEHGVNAAAALEACKVVIDESGIENVWGESCWAGGATEILGEPFVYVLAYTGAFVPRASQDLAFPLCVVLR